MDNIRKFYEIDYPQLHPDLDQDDTVWKFSHLLKFLKGACNCDSHPAHPIILDIGCGCGKLLQDVAAFLKGQPIGLDLSFSILSQAKKLFPMAGYIQSRAEALPIKLEKINLIYFADLLEHLEDPIKFLQGLKEARLLLMYIPLESGFLSDLVYLYQGSINKTTNRQIYGHLHRWNQRGCISLLKDAGLHLRHYQVVRAKKHPYTTWRGKLYGFLSEACYLFSPALHKLLFGGYALIASCKGAS